jgi:hypothetical protein
MSLSPTTRGFIWGFHQDVLSQVELEVYSTFVAGSKTGDESPQVQLLAHLKTRFAVYQRRLEKFLSSNDSFGFEECILDFWDEFLPQTAYIQYYDRHTAVPRLSCLHKFLTRPCPKAVGIIQCEIERIKVGSKKKGVNMKGRFFPTYEYRLFIRHRPVDSSENGDDEFEGIVDRTPRRDTVLMMAKNKGRKHSETGKSPGPSSSKKGANNYYLYLPQQEDVDLHYKGVNKVDSTHKRAPNGASMFGLPDDSSSLLGRLQSNFIGTEFQIFTPRVAKMKPKPLTSRSVTAPHVVSPGVSSDEECVIQENGPSSSESNNTFSRRRSRFARLSLLGRSGNNTEQRMEGDDDPSQLLDTPVPSAPVLRRSRSSGDMIPGRKSRPSNRRVSAADALDSQHRPVQLQPTFIEEEDGAITYTANLLGSRPRIMDVCVPRIASGGAGVEWRRYLESFDDNDNYASANRMLNHLKQFQQRGEEGESFPSNNQTGGRDSGDGGEYSPPNDYGLLALQNRPPWWNVELGSFVLNFGGRVSVASVKNFQLCEKNDQDYIMLQFGRIQGRHSFTMDFQYPLTAVQAFAIAISSLQSKISFG